MPRDRSSAEERIIQFFREAPLEVAQVVLNLAKSAVKARVEETATPQPVKRRKRRVKKVAENAPAAAPQE